MSLVSDLLLRVPVLDRDTMLLTRPWQQFLAALLLRAGGSGEVITLADLASVVTGLSGLANAEVPPPALIGGNAPMTLYDLWPDHPAQPRRHISGGPPAPPVVVASDAGAGVGATATVSGTDSAGTIELTTVARAERRSNSPVVALTFAIPYASPPVVVVAPANDATWGLLYGRWLKDGRPVSVRLIQSSVTTTGFPLSVGVARLPREAGVYAWNYISIGV